MPKARKAVPPEKTVFISYRREPSLHFAKIVHDYLRRRAYSVFWDIEKIDNGAFDEAILHNITSCMHFLILLSPATLERCNYEDGTPNLSDWLRREIEYAIDTERNIVPILTHCFRLEDASKYLTGKLEHLSKFQATPIYNEFMDEGLARLGKRYLKLPQFPVQITELNTEESKIAEFKEIKAITAPIPTPKELSAEDFFNRAFEKQKVNDYEGAITDYSKAISLNLYYPAPYNNRGVVRALKHDYDGAILDYTSAIRLNPTYAQAYNNRGVAYGERKDFDFAIEDFTKAIELSPTFIEAYCNRGSIYHEKKDFANAIHDYNKAIDLNPSYAEAYNNRGNTYRDIGDFDDAMQDYNKAIELNPRLFQVYSNRAGLYFKLGDYISALQDVETSINLNPNYESAYLNRAIIFIEQRNYESAVKDYDKVIALRPNLATPYYYRGLLYAKLEDSSNALVNYSKVIELDPNHYEAHNSRGIIYSENGDLLKGIEDFSKAIELSPQFKFYYNRCQSYLRTEDYHKALLDAQKLIELEPKDAYGYFARAYINGQQQNKTDALQDYDLVIALDSRHHVAFANRGEIYFELHSFESALSDLQKAYELEPSYKFTIAGLAITHNALGNVDEALKLWRQLLEKDEQYRDAEWVRKELNWAEPLVEEAKKLIARL